MVERRTDQLRHGDRVQLTRSIVRTVWRLEFHEDYFGAEDIYTVHWREDSSPEWGSGNSASGARLWNVVTATGVLEVVCGCAGCGADDCCDYGVATGSLSRALEAGLSYDEYRDARSGLS